jgi:hypothetical protein
LPLDALPPFWLSRGFELARRRLAESDDKDAWPAIIKDLDGLNAKSGWTALALLAFMRSEHVRTLLARHSDLLLEGKASVLGASKSNVQPRLFELWKLLSRNSRA